MKKYITQNCKVARRKWEKLKKKIIFERDLKKVFSENF